MAILGELSLTDGSITKKGRVAYASQEPWIFNGTIKYNITFGHEFNEQRYNEVIKACALERVSYRFDLILIFELSWIHFIY